MLKDYHADYERIMVQLEGEERDKAIAELMSEMEKAFRIPMIRNQEWEQENRKVIALYRKLSMSRS